MNFNASAASINFDDKQKAANTINAWALAATNGKIVDLLQVPNGFNTRSI
jgi:serine protease inhibitor